MKELLLRLHLWKYQKMLHSKFPFVMLGMFLLRRPKRLVFKMIQPNNDPALISRIEEALNQLRPYLEADSGNVSFLEVTEDMIVKLKFIGACSSCSMSMMTLKAGIE